MRESDRILIAISITAVTSYWNTILFLFMWYYQLKHDGKNNIVYYGTITGQLYLRTVTYFNFFRWFKCDYLEWQLLGFCQNFKHPWLEINFRNVRRVHRFILCLNYMMIPLVLYPLPLLRQCIATFTVAEGWLLLDIGWFILFLNSIIKTNAKSIFLSNSRHKQIFVCVLY